MWAWKQERRVFFNWQLVEWIELQVAISRFCIRVLSCTFVDGVDIHPMKLNSSPLKMMVGKHSFPIGKGKFSGDFAAGYTVFHLQLHPHLLTLPKFFCGFRNGSRQKKPGIRTHPSSEIIIGWGCFRQDLYVPLLILVMSLLQQTTEICRQPTQQLDSYKAFAIFFQHLREPCQLYTYKWYTPEDWHRTWKWWFGRWFSFSGSVFSGSILIFRSVIPYLIKSLSCANPRIPNHQWINISDIVTSDKFWSFHFIPWKTLPKIHWAEKITLNILGISETLYIPHFKGNRTTDNPTQP